MKPKKSTYNYTDYPSRLRHWIGKHETVQEAAQRYDEEIKHSLQHEYFCRSNYCTYHRKW